MHHQTNSESTQIDSEDHLSVSRFRSPYAWSNWAPGSISIHVLSRIGTVLEDEQVMEGLLGFALAFYRLANATTSVFNAITSVFVSEVSCSLSSYSLSIKSVTNLFDPWEILTHEWELIVFVHRFKSNFHTIFTLQVAGCDFQNGPNFWCSLESNLSGQLIFHLLVKYTHDMSLALQIVWSRQCALSWSTVRLQLFSGILHQYKSLYHSIWLWKPFHSFFAFPQ